eukprot:849123-Prymnesium_polylepis.1
MDQKQRSIACTEGAMDQGRVVHVLEQDHAGGMVPAGAVDGVSTALERIVDGAVQGDVLQHVLLVGAKHRHELPNESLRVYREPAAGKEKGPDESRHRTLEVVRQACVLPRDAPVDLKPSLAAGLAGWLHRFLVPHVPVSHHGADNNVLVPLDIEDGELHAHRTHVHQRVVVHPRHKRKVLC